MIKSKWIIILSLMVILGVVAVPYALQWNAGKIGSTGTSDLPQIQSCVPKGIPVQLTGVLSVGDKAWLNLEPQPVITGLSAVQISQNFLGIFVTDYVANVKVVQNGVTIGQNGAISGSLWNNINRAFTTNYPYTVNFVMMDNNCDGLVDPFRAQLVATLSPSDQAALTVTKSLQYNSNGSVVLS